MKLTGISAAVVCCALAGHAGAAAVTQNVSWSNTVNTRFPTPLPSNSVGTSFTSYTGSTVPYVTRTFYVGTSGAYSFQLAPIGPQVASGILILTGTFTGASATNPSVPLGNFLAGIQGFPTSGIPSLTLTAGQQYSYLLLFSSGTNGTGTFNLSGIGCISFDVDTCTVPVVVPVPLPAVAAAGDALNNRAAHNAAVVIDANPQLAVLFSGLSGNAAISSAASQTLPLLTGGSTAAIQGAMTSVSNIIQARLGHVSGRASGDSFLGDKNVWMKPFASRADQDNHDGVAGYKAETYGVAGGFDGAVSPALRLGGAFAYASSNINGKSADAPQGSDVNIYQVIGYGSYALDARTEVNFQADVGRNTNKGYRQIAFTSSVAASDYDSKTAHAGIGLGRSYALSGRTTLTPSIRADYTWIKDKSYSETGAGLLNLNVASRSTDALVFGIDGRLAHQLNDQATLIANLGVGYDAINQQNAITAAFAGAANSAFVTYGINPSPWTSRGGIGAVYKLKNGFEITGRYDVEYRKDFLNQTASANVRWTF